MATYLMKYGSLETKVRANIWFQLFFFFFKHRYGARARQLYFPDAL